MIRWIASIIIIGVLFFGGCKVEDKPQLGDVSANKNVLYVAPDGSDDNPGTKDKPFATIAKAKAQVRSLKSKVDGPVTVMVRGGTYYLTETLVFTPADSGTADAPIVYASVAGEKPVISGAVVLDAKWQQYKDGIMKCSIPQGIEIDQLFVNSQRRMRARYPNFDPENPLMGDGGYINAVDSGEEDGHDAVYYDSETFTDKKWANPSEAIIHIFPGHYWHNAQFRLYSVNYETNAMVLGEGGWQTFEFMAGNSFGTSSRYFIDNVFEELDAPDEWYFDKQNLTLYYIPPQGLDINNALVEIPQLKQLVNFIGTVENPAHHIKMDGFKFTHTMTTFMDKYEIPSAGDWGIHRGGTAFFEGAEDCAIENSFFDAVGGNAVFVSNHNRRIKISGNKFAHTGDSAVLLCGINNMNDESWTCEYCGIDRPWDFSDVEECPAECVVSNNEMHHIGEYGKQTAGVFMAMTKNNTISHNHIYHMPRSGICINDPFWGGHVIEFNDIHDTVLESDDHGPFNSWGRGHYWCLGINRVQVSHVAGDVKRDARRPTVIRNNRFRDKNTYGIVMDDGAAFFHVYNNLCIGTGLQNREGEFRIVENNIFINPSHAIGYDVGHEYNHDQFLRNIVVINSDYDVAHAEVGDTSYKSANTQEEGGNMIYRVVYPPDKGKWINEIDYNVLFNYDEPGTKGFALNFAPRGDQQGADTWQQWQALGFDKHSVFAEPMFVDPAKGDFTVKPDSAALKLGFVNFEMDKFGLLPDFTKKWD